MDTDDTKKGINDQTVSGSSLPDTVSTDLADDKSVFLPPDEKQNLNTEEEPYSG